MLQQKRKKEEKHGDLMNASYRLSLLGSFKQLHRSICMHVLDLVFPARVLGSPSYIKNVSSPIEILLHT
jgi:hypothetical protein